MNRASSRPAYPHPPIFSANGRQVFIHADGLAENFATAASPTAALVIAAALNLPRYLELASSSERGKTRQVLAQLGTNIRDYLFLREPRP